MMQGVNKTIHAWLCDRKANILSNAEPVSRTRLNNHERDEKLG